MKCPACGNDERQKRLGPLPGDRPIAVYHCQACDELYADVDDDELDEETGDED